MQKVSHLNANINKVIFESYKDQRRPFSDDLYNKMEDCSIDTLNSL